MKRRTRCLSHLRTHGAALLAGALALACSGDPPARDASAQARLQDPAGNEVGNVAMHATPNGLLVRIAVDGLPPGPHALHVHERGRCDPPFDSAGGHFAPDGSAHGFLNREGPHAGDLPNLVVPASGRLEVETLVRGLEIRGGDGGLLDEDGSAVVVHAGRDDYRSQPAGDAGGRIACGVIAAR